MSYIKTVSLGWCVAKADFYSSGVCKSLTIISPSDVSENGNFSPAQDVTLWGEDNIKALRDLCNELLKEK